MESPKKIAFVSWHNYLDQTNGASISTRALLLALAMRGWRVMTFCGPTFDRFEPSLCQYLDRHADLSQVVHKSFNERNLKFMLSRFMDGRIRSLSFFGELIKPSILSWALLLHIHAIQRMGRLGLCVLPMDCFGDPTALLTHPTLLSPLPFGDGRGKIKTCTLWEDGKKLRQYIIFRFMIIIVFIGRFDI